MAKLGECHDCKFWKRLTKTTHFLGFSKWTEKVNGLFGNCEKLEEDRPIGMDEIEKFKQLDDRAFYFTHECSCNCVTGQNFGCIHFKEKTRKAVNS